MSNNTFSYSYSGGTKTELEQFKEKYSPKQTTEKMKKIRSLDKRVDFISTMISIFMGIIGSFFLVSGIIFMIKDLLPFTAGISMAAIGLLITTTVPFIHSSIYNLVKKHYAEQILSLIEEIEQNHI